MLPSTGYFKGISCPFNDSGFCERPYCHFRHVKKDVQNAVGEGIESGAAIQKLVSAAVQKVLQHTDGEQLEIGNPAPTYSDVDVSKVNKISALGKATYNPTPISELKKIHNAGCDNLEDTSERKKHIPVPYTPRKPASFNVKRIVETNGDAKPLIYIPPAQYTPGGTDISQLDPYTPKGSLESNEKYLPGSEVKLQQYTPNNESQPSSNINYVPSDKSNGKKKLLEYEPAKVSSKHGIISSITYQPTAKSSVPCFSSDEEEPDPKKRKLSNQLDELDDLGPEFDILDQILDEEKPEQTKNENVTRNKEKDKSKEKHTKEKSKHEVKVNKKDKYKSDEKHLHSKSRSEKDLERKSHKSSQKDKEKSSETSSKKSHDSKKHSSTQKSDQHRKKSKDDEKHKTSKSSEKSSRNSSSCKSVSKDKSRHKHKHHKSSKEREKEKYHKDKKKVITISDDENGVNADDDGHIIDDELLEISESDEETITEECKKIFEEYVPQEKNTIADNLPTEEKPEEREYIPSKKRISHTSVKDLKVIPKAPLKPNFKVSAAQTMAERVSKLKEYHESKKVHESPVTDIKSIKPNNFNTTASVNNSKIRIAHVPYATTLMTAKKVIAHTTKEKPSTSSTVIQTVKRGEQRVAHIPNEKFIDRPGVLEPLASKIAANIRSTYLNMMIDECLKIYLSPSDAYARAQHEELATSKKCSTVQIYKNSAVLTVSRLRKEFQECNGIKKSGSDCATLQKLPQAGMETNSGTWSIQSKYKRAADNPKEFIGSKLYDNLKKWILTEQQLQDNGFPRPHPSGEKGRAMIYIQNKQKSPKGYIRTCCRCKKDYTVDKKNFPIVKEECIYHPNNKYRVRGEAKYQCCSQDSSSDGCCVAPCHVYEYVDFDNLKGFVKTLLPETSMDDYGVYSLDCEMCYTTHGLDLTRITVINSACKIVYETLIKPLHPIIDYNTRYSGITEEQMTNVKTTLLEVQATLLSMFTRKTILIGHSLESDFKALKLIHDTVIDTSVLFPHKMGPPYKRALRNLSSEYLKKIIQNSVDGHDSAEDATVCMELVIYKLKEDLKTR